MSGVTRLDVTLPQDVEAATSVLSSPLRSCVLHELSPGPITTTELMVGLGVADRTTMTTNLGDLEQHGVVTGSPFPRSRAGRTITWTGNPARITELTRRLNRHLTRRR